MGRKIVRWERGRPLVDKTRIIDCSSPFLPRRPARSSIRRWPDPKPAGF